MKQKIAERCNYITDNLYILSASNFALNCTILGHFHIRFNFDNIENSSKHLITIFLLSTWKWHFNHCSNVKFDEFNFALMTLLQYVRNKVNLKGEQIKIQYWAVTYNFYVASSTKLLNFYHSCHLPQTVTL